jgi:hypothetical protein
MPQYEAGVRLLKELERLQGLYSLELGPLDVTIGDAGKLLDHLPGGVPKDLSSMKPVDMFTGARLDHLIHGSRILLTNKSSILQEVPIAFTSIPILNACAIRHDNALAIALNMRLATTLMIVNSLRKQMEINYDNSDFESVRKLATLQTKILKSSSSPHFGTLLYESVSTANEESHNLGGHLANFQLLFILLHECAHITCKHLDDSSLWNNHPLTSPSGDYFAGSIDTEYEADEQAISWLLNRNSWSLIGSEFPVVREDLPFGFEAAPTLILRLFTWFHQIAPENQSDYYKIPRSHPHPLDRAFRIKKVVDKYNEFDLDLINDLFQDDILVASDTSSLP